MSWGILTSINLYDCDYVKITSKEAIKEFSNKLVELLDMKAYGEPQIVHFGETPAVEGFTLIQLIHTSHIAAHFVNSTRDIYLDIFSCKPYDSEKASEFAREFFLAQKKEFGCIRRGRNLDIITCTWCEMHY